ncbi:MAG: threonine synthase [Betaproteobacteria bacterium]|nr:threonine synthase [Betaproteobacteria bacterium]
MRYISTRGGGTPQSFTQILLGGLAPDGGLYVPATMPALTTAEIERLRPLNYRELAFAVLSIFIDDIPAHDLKSIVDRAYTSSVFRSTAIAPLKTFTQGLNLLQLSNGPTLAFKDMAMQFLGHLFEYVLAKEGRSLNILGATSGDTGSSAEYAMRGKKGIHVFMLSPHERMSAFQRAQMFSLQDANIHNIAIRGVFDDCQDVVKVVSSDASFKAQYRIGAVNSINWARIAAQVVYYFKGYFAATSKAGEEVSFAVPSGNFGNIYAGYVARRMGLPIGRLMLATNENDVLDEFFRTGHYRVRKGAEIHATSSPSMDISKASNFERFVFEIVGRGGAVVAELWQRLEETGSFDLSASQYWVEVKSAGIISGRSTHAERLGTIRRIARDFNVIIDPHTADGVKIGTEAREVGETVICLETALPVKFAATIKEALGAEPVRPAGYENIESLPQRFEVMDPDVDAVKAFIAQHAR